MELLLGKGANVEASEPGFLLVEEAAGPLYALDGVHGPLNFLQLDPVAHVLDLEVLPAAEYQLPQLVVLGQVPCAVDPLRIMGIQRILDEVGGVLLRVSVVAQGQAGAPDADLPLGTGLRHQPVLPVQQEHVLVGEGLADGDAGGIVPVLVQDVIGAVAGDLRRAVEVYISHIRQMLPEFLQGLQGHDLSGVEDPLHRLRGPVVQGVEAGDQAQGRHGPDHGGGSGVAEEVDKLGGQGEEPPGHHRQTGSGLQGGINILDGYVEVKGSLVGDHIGTVDAKQGHEAVQKIQHAAVAYGNALGHAGGAGGEVDVQHIRIAGPGLTLRQCLRVLRGSLQVLEGHDPLGREESLCLFQQRLLGDDEAGGQDGHDLLQPGAGELRIQAGVEASRPDGSHKDSHGVGALLHIHAHRLPLAHIGAEPGADAPGQVVVFPIGVLLLIVQHRLPVRIGAITGFQIFQNVVHSFSSFTSIGPDLRLAL